MASREVLVSLEVVVSSSIVYICTRDCAGESLEFPYRASCRIGNEAVRSAYSDELPLRIVVYVKSQDGGIREMGLQLLKGAMLIRKLNLMWL